MQITFQEKRNPFENSIQPLKEMAAYEWLWKDYGSSFKKIAEIFARNPGTKPSDLVASDEIVSFLRVLKDVIGQNSLPKPGILVNNSFDYPKRLRDAEEPVEVLYYEGSLGLLQTRSLAVVGTRKPTPDGLKRTENLVKQLVKDDFTIASGLAEGIDTKAHKTAIENKGRTFAVIGTPLNQYYPKQNKELQDLIAEKFLLISQVPFYRYTKQDYRHNRSFFPERNKTMSALTEGTIIVEASETSGTLIQAKAAIQQKRKLFILENNFQNPAITWPKRFEELGAIRVRTYEDIRSALLV